MKNNFGIFLTIICSSVLTACDSNEPLDPYLNNYLLQNKADEIYDSYANSIKSFNSYYDVDYINTAGSKVTKDSFGRYIESKKAYEKCHITLTTKDVYQTGGFISKFFGLHETEIKKTYDIKPFNNCIENYLKTNQIELDNQSYVLADHRIKQYRFVADKTGIFSLDIKLREISNDGKFTFLEVTELYKTLDRIIEVTLKNDLKKLSN